MARYLGPVCKLCRREGVKLFLKGERCYSSEKCAFDRRPYPPGQHGKGRTKVSEYGKRLREKQKVRRVYGILERQFRTYFAAAARRKGVTGENLLKMLESRIDNVAFRLGFGATRSDARQLVRHNHVLVNGRRVDIPSFGVKAGDVISLSEKARKFERVQKSLELSKSRERIPWIEAGPDGASGTFKAAPSRIELEAAQPVEIEEQLVVEFYSR